MNNLIEKLRDTMLSRFSAKQNNKFANIIMMAGVLVNTYEILTNFTSFNLPLTIIAIGLVVIGAVYQAIVVRCPVCGDKLKGKAAKMMDHCPNCNHDLDVIPN